MKARIFGSLVLIPILVLTVQAQVKSEPPTRVVAEKVLAADPFDLGTGIYFRTYTDLFVPDSIPINFVRTQRNQDAQERAFGVGSSTSYDMFIIGDVNRFSWVALVMADGSQEHFDRISSGTGYADGVFENKTSPTEFYGARISWNRNGGWTVKRRDGVEYTIRGCSPSTKRPGQCAVTEITNPKGERLIVQRDRDGNLLEIRSPHGRKVSIMNDQKGRIIRAADDDGHWIIYSYNSRGCLIKTMNWRKEHQWFTYDANLNMAIVRESGPGDNKEGPYAFSVVNHYDEKNRFKSQEVSNGDTFEAKYTDGANGNISRTEVLERHGVYICDFNPSGYVVREEYTNLNKVGWTLNYDRNDPVNAVVDMRLVCSYKGKKVVERHLPAEMIQSLGGIGDTHKMYVFGLCQRMLTIPQQRDIEEEQDRVALNRPML